MQHFGPKHNQAISEEIDKSLVTKMVWQVQYLTWLANPAMVNKLGDGWHVCMDYTDLNKASPKDYNPLLRIDALVDLAMGNEILYILDIF